MDTETTLLESRRWEWRRHGLELDPAGFFADHGGYTDDARYAALRPAPGIVDWLDRAGALGLRLAVASSSPLWHVGALLDQAALRARFDVVATGNPHADVTRFASADVVLARAADRSLDAV